MPIVCNQWLHRNVSLWYGICGIAIIVCKDSVGDIRSWFAAQQARLLPNSSEPDNIYGTFRIGAFPPYMVFRLSFAYCVFFVFNDCFAAYAIIGFGITFGANTGIYWMVATVGIFVPILWHILMAPTA